MIHPGITPKLRGALSGKMGLATWVRHVSIGAGVGVGGNDVYTTPAIYGPHVLRAVTVTQQQGMSGARAITVAACRSPNGLNAPEAAIEYALDRAGRVVATFPNPSQQRYPIGKRIPNRETFYSVRFQSDVATFFLVQFELEYSG